MKAQVQTVGCRLNQYYSQLLREALARAGYETESVEISEADIVVINGCSVTGRAERDTRRKIRRALEGGARVFCVGCPGESVGLPGVKILSYDALARDLGLSLAPGIGRFSGRARALLRVQVGCDFSCSYCVVPRTRGPSRSRPLPEILGEAEALAAAGYRELVLTGTQIGDWGKEQGLSLAHLLQVLLDEVPGVRFRLSSLEPAHLGGDLLSLMASAGWRVARHLHLPLQSASDPVLADMGRAYTLRDYAAVAERALGVMEDLALGTDIIAGFPTETEEDFLTTLSFFGGFPFAYAHIFSYSPRPGTPAFRLGSLGPDIVKERVARLVESDREKRVKFRGRFVGRELLVLGETRKKGFTRSTSGNYIRVLVPGLEPGELAVVRATGEAEGGLVGERVKEKEICPR